MNRCFFTVAAIVSLQLFGASYMVASAKDVDSGISYIAKSFAKKAGEQKFTGATVAVMPFKVGEKLARQRLDQACAELLSNHLAKTGAFKLVERAGLDSVLKEQALAAGGIVDSESAAKMGELLGAKFVVIGTAFKAEDNYNISAKLVDAETSELAASEVIQVDRKLFEEESESQGIRLVPDQEALGIYFFGFGLGPKASLKTAPPTPLTAGGTITPHKSNYNLWGLGVGVKYFVSPKWFMDLAIHAGMKLTGDEDHWADKDGNNGSGHSVELNGVSPISLSVNRSYSPSQTWRLSGGAGVMMLKFKGEGTLKYDNSNENMLDFGQDGNLTSTIWAPIAKVSAEYRLKQRFSVGIAGNFIFKNVEINEKAKYSISGHTPQEVSLGTVKLPTFYPSLSLNFYF